MRRSSVPTRPDRHAPSALLSANADLRTSAARAHSPAIVAHACAGGRPRLVFPFHAQARGRITHSRCTIRTCGKETCTGPLRPTSDRFRALQCPVASRRLRARRCSAGRPGLARVCRRRMGSGRVERAKGRAAGAAAARKAGKAKEYSSHASGRHHFPLIKQPGCYAEPCGALSGSRVRWWCPVMHQPAGARPHDTSAQWLEIVRALCRDEARAEATERRPEGDLAMPVDLISRGTFSTLKFEKTRRKQSLKPVFLYATASSS